MATPKDKDPAKPKTQSQLIIQKNFDKLHQNINLKSLQPHLEASSLLTKQLSEHLQLPGLTDHEKKTTLLSHLLHNHEDCIGELIQCLRKADDHLPHQELAKMLENQPDQLEVYVDEQPPTSLTVEAPPNDNVKKVDNDDGIGLDPEIHLLPDQLKKQPSFCGVLSAICLRACLCYMCGFLLLALLALAAIIPAVIWYQGEEGYDIQAQMNQTVVVPLEKHLHSISLSHNLKTPCVQQAAVIPCSNLKSNLTCNVTSGKFFSGQSDRWFYLLNGSNISLQCSPDKGWEVTSVTFWIFNNFTEFEKARSLLNDANPPLCSESSLSKYKNGTACKNFSDNEIYSMNYTVSFPSFYYLLCFVNSTVYGTVDCGSFAFRWRMDVYWYNYSLNVQYTYPQLNVTNKEKALVLRKALDPLLYTTEPSQCLLLHTPRSSDGACESQSHPIMVTVSDINKVADVWLFAGVTIVALLIVCLFMTLVGHVSCYCQEKKRQGTLPEMHRMDNRARNEATNSTTALLTQQ